MDKPTMPHKVMCYPFFQYCKGAIFSKETLQHENENIKKKKTPVNTKFSSARIQKVPWSSIVTN